MKGCVTRILYILMFEINCVLYSGSTTKQIQISQNVDAATHCPITPPTKINHQLAYSDTNNPSAINTPRLMESSRTPGVTQENLRLTSRPHCSD